MININTKEYWEGRFSSGNWNSGGKKQTKEYAKANILNMNLENDFDGSIIDFGCALGDAIPIYSEAFPNAKLIGVDISDAAINRCKHRYGNIAEFYSGTHTEIPNADIIIASHVMEHLTNDKMIVADLLTKCSDLYVFVPFKEKPLYFEHVNCYNEKYYNKLNVSNYITFNVNYKSKFTLTQYIKNILNLKFNITYEFSKEIIMFHFKGNKTIS